MNWKESHEFVKTFTDAEKARYRHLTSRCRMDGANAHLYACDKIKEEREKN